MFSTKKTILAVVVFAGSCAISATMRTAIAAGQPANAATQTANIAAPATAKIAAGETEAKKLLLLMDTDKTGKVSRAEFMSFMAAEFDRLDTNHDGELDVKELEQSQLVTVHHGGSHR